VKGKVAGPPVGDSNHPTPHTSDWQWLGEEFAIALPLREGVVDVPLLAAWAMGENRHAAAAPVLQQMLDTRKANGRVFARAVVIALATIKGEEVADGLLGLARHNRGGVRYAAVWAMGRLYAHRFAKELRAALADRDSSVKLAAARALARTGSREGASIVLKFMNGWFTAADLREEAFEAAQDMLLLDALPSLGSWVCQTSNRQLRQTAGVALTHILTKTPDEKVTSAAHEQGQSAKSLLRQVNALFELEVEGAGRAAARLITVGGEDLVRRLERSSEDRWFASANPQAIRALRAAGKGGDASVWMKRLMHKNEEIAEGAAYALYNIGDKACEATLLKESLDNKNHRRRMYALIALGGCGTPRVLEKLKPLVSGNDRQVAVCAGIALAEIGARYLAESTATGTPAAIVTLWSVESFTVRAALVQYLALAGYQEIVPKAVDEMRNAYGDGPFAAYRAVMARALGLLKNQSAVTALAEAALGDPNSMVADTARRAYNNVTGQSVDTGSVSQAEATARYLKRFNELLLIDVLADQGTSVAGSLFRPGIVWCCAICRSRAERFVRMEDRAQRASMIYTYRVGIPVCWACHIDGLPPADLIYLRDWSIEFRNPGFATMNTDASWLATSGFALSNVIF